MKIMHKKNIVIGSILSGCIVISSFFAGIGGVWVGNRVWNTNQAGPQNQTVKINTEDSQVINVAEQASPAVVSIVVTKDLPQYEDYDPFDGFYSTPRRSLPDEETQVGAGSGFIISKEGLILTNRHVVNDEDANYTVVLNDGTKYTAEVIGRDTILDIAVVKIDADDDLPILQFADSSQIKVGQFVIAIGNSLGEFSNTVSTGIVSGLSRSIIAGDGGGSSERLEGVIQTDASINPGNSGGPLLDILGNVIGINVAIASDAENIGFAIPINAVKQVVDSVVEFGEIVRPYIGVRYTNITKEYAEVNNLSVEAGAHIGASTDKANPAIIPNSPAAKADLRSGDIIIEVNGEKLTKEVTLQDAVQKYKVGDTIQLKFLRGDEEKIVEVTLEKRN